MANSDLPPAATAFLATDQGQHCEAVVKTFHYWIADNGLQLERLTSYDIESFLQRPRRTSTGRRVSTTFAAKLRRYLDSLKAQGRVSVDSRCLDFGRDMLPRVADTYVVTKPAAKTVVQRFHKWLCRTHRCLRQLALHDIQTYWGGTLSPRGLTLGKRRHRILLIEYLEWLRSKQELSFEPRYLREGAVPPIAELFFEQLRSTRKPSTIGSYRTSVRGIHTWLRVRGLQLKNLTRDHMVEWFNSLRDRGLHPSTRVSIITNVTVYLQWLDQREALACDAAELVRPTDKPKLPTYLPRPLSPEVDRKLQQRLAESKSKYRQGLLLMRRTGLRIGELIALPYDCTRSDLEGHTYLKVPLGKMNNERLVPIDSNAAGLIEQLQDRGHANRKWLLESRPGRQTVYPVYRAHLQRLHKQLSLTEPLLSHRLRHTYATTLLNGGMSLVGLMKLLGHRDHRMTLRYAAITLQTVTTEYHQALERTAERYSLPGLPTRTAELEPVRLLTELLTWVQKRGADHASYRSHANLLGRRIRRLRNDIRSFAPGGRGGA